MVKPLLDEAEITVSSPFLAILWHLYQPMSMEGISATLADQYRETPQGLRMLLGAFRGGNPLERIVAVPSLWRLRQIDGRIRFLTKRIEAAEVVDPEAPRAGQAATRAFFGATVRYANAAGAERVVSIVGTDEIDLNRNHISWVSPLGRALMKSAAGDSVILQVPSGTEYLTVLEVYYERISVEPFREPAGAEASAKKLPRRR